MKLRTRKKRFFKKIETTPIEGTEFNSFDTESLYYFSVTTKQAFIFVSVLLVAILSAYLRVQGIMDIFKISLEASVYIVITFIVAEFVIANIFLSEGKNKILEMFVLGLIQLILICLSFVLEFSALSQKISETKNTNTITMQKEVLLNEQKHTLNEQTALVLSEYHNLPENRLGLRQRALTSINELNQKKASLDTQINELSLDKK